MQIFIEFDSIWQNSFLSGSDDKPIDKNNKRKFIATSKSDKIDHKKITKSTVLGILSRLIGDQRKLYDARASDNYYFKDKEDLISEPIVNLNSWDEQVFLSNKTESRPPLSSYLGVIKEDEKLFFSETAPLLWSILYMDIDELLTFILSDKMNDKKGDSKPNSLLKRIEILQDFEPFVFVKDDILRIETILEKKKENFRKKEEEYLKLSSPNLKQEKSFIKLKEKLKKEEFELRENINLFLKDKDREVFDKKLGEIIDLLSKKYPDKIYYDKGKVYVMSLYSIALYLQVERMISNNLNVDYCLKNSGEIQVQGFSKRNFNGVRDFLNKLAGNHKKTVGTPSVVTKASGELIITLNITQKEADDLKNMIDDAGVSSFYLGKKGLAYVRDIITEEED